VADVHLTGTFEERAERQLRSTELPHILGRAMDRMASSRAAAFDGIDRQAMRDAGRRIRDHTIVNLTDYLERFADRAETRGTNVFFAADAAEANAYVLDIVRRRQARLVAKGKSMISEEIGLNAELEAAGVQVVETDLGERIVQVAGEPPSHILAPAVHMTRTDIAGLFERTDGTSLPDDEPATITAFARERLREVFLRADVGITGVNFAVAESGCFVLVTNEGNGRMCSTLPKVHIALMGMERIVPSFRELSVLLPLLTGSATGQRASTYLSVVGGPARSGDGDGPEEVHVVVLDNGRSRILSTEYRSILHCIRCGACQNVCPVYRVVGGHGYGAVYGGPIGAVLTPLLVGFDKAGDLPHASSLCGACTEVCPVGIPLHEHLLGLRRDVAAQQAPITERVAFGMWSRVWSKARTYRWAASLARVGQVPFSRRRRIRRAPWPLSRWTRGRDLPGIAPRSFRDAWRRSSKGT
jgi:L-lactate dehydrogenase complex protein LldF